MRYLLALWTAQEFQPSFPAATLAVNLIGSFILAVLMALGSGTSWLSPTLSLALTTGVMGGFTTYSTFSYETMGQLQRGDRRQPEQHRPQAARGPLALLHCDTSRPNFASGRCFAPAVVSRRCRVCLSSAARSGRRVCMHV